HREDDRREREDEIRASHAKAIERAAEVAGDRPDDRSDRRGERHDEERERHLHPRPVDHAAEDVAAELVGAEKVLPRRPRRSREALRKGIRRRDKRSEYRHPEPAGHDHEADDGERLAQTGVDPASTCQRACAEHKGGHETRILGSMTPYRMSTMKFTVT